MISYKKFKDFSRTYLKNIIKKEIDQYKIGLSDPSLGSNNIGDEIISESVNNQLRKIFPHFFFVKGFTQQKNGIPISLSLMRLKIIFVGGSNLLSKQVLKWNQWLFSNFDLVHLKHKFILLGVGNWKYQKRIGFLTRFFYKRILHKGFIHSVRDNYTLLFLKEIGITNVINTGCPTLWDITPEHCKEIPRKKAPDVVFTITDYGNFSFNKYKLFEEMITLFIIHYKKVFFFPQGANDLQVFNRLVIQNKEKITILAPDLKVYNEFLENNEVDYIGTRLHGGIKALQCAKRTMLIGIDNRAIEKKKDFNIPVVRYDELDELERLITMEWPTEIRIPIENINKWKSQFKKL